MRKRYCAAVLLLLLCRPVFAGDGVQPTPQVGRQIAQFDQSVALLLARRCLDCHNATDKKSGLDLSQKLAAMRGGESGPVIVPGRPEQSFLWERIADDEMPPEQPLTTDEKKLLKSWIAGGANWGTDPIDPFRVSTSKRAGYDWWSLQPVERPKIPAVLKTGWIHNPIDAFVLAKLETGGLGPSPLADRRTLFRRLSFDLLGLPPSPAEVDVFLADSAPDAYERLVDRLLASPHYGERWARHWLDIVRFGESQGFERDKVRPNSWRYRDWVVSAFNRDLRYNQFARLQLAGDVLTPQDPAGAIATGFLVAGPYDEVGQNQQSAAMRAVVRQDELEDIVSLVGQTFLGLTVNCARCHDHKFDPVRQVEYYRLTAALGGVRHGERNLNHPEIASRSAEHVKALTAHIDELKQQLSAIDEPVRRQILARLDPAQQQQREVLQFEIAELEQQRKRTGVTTSYAVVPRKPEVAHLLKQGNPAQWGDVVSPSGVAALVSVSADFGLPSDGPEALRRVALARWITHQNNPLFARVIVNRLWHFHFGVGLVDTPSDFGFNEARPTHPALIDWLASELVRHDWRLKAVQRMIVTSAVYRQTSRFESRAAKIDAGNRLLWRKSPLRLDAEVIRDSILAVTGQLNRTLGGPGYRDFTTFVRNTQFHVPVDAVGHSFNRRSLYRMWVRSGRNRFLDVFDCPDPSTKTPKRAVTTTPLQALSLLNNSFVLRMADRFAERLEREVGDDVEQQLALAYTLTYGRHPRPEETNLTEAFIKQQGLPAFCRVLFNSNEFLHVD